MADAFIKLYRNMLDWEWYDDVNTKMLFLHILLRANWKAGSWHGIKYDAGEFITSLQTLADEVHLSVHQVRTALDHLKATGEVTSRCQGKTRIITVNNWNKYQVGGKVSGKVAARSRQGGGKVVAIDKEYKEREEGEELKNINTPYNPPQYFPNDETLDRAFADYVAMRKQIKKPMTDRAVDLAIKKLDELSCGDNDLAVKIINQSIMNSWQGLFPLKEEPRQSQTIDWSKV